MLQKLYHFLTKVLQKQLHVGKINNRISGTTKPKDLNSIIIIILISIILMGVEQWKNLKTEKGK